MQYLILGESAQPYLLARVRWPDVAQAISEDCPGWLDDPGLFDLPYEPVSQRVSSSRAAEIAADWGAELPLASSAGFSRPRIRRVPPSWSDMVPVERWSWSLEHLATVRRTEPSHRLAVARGIGGLLQRSRDAHATMTDTRDAARGRRRASRRPKHARRSENDFPWPDAPGAPNVQPRLAPTPPGGRDLRPPPATPHLGSDYRLRGLNLGSRRRRRCCRRRRPALRPHAVGPEPASGGSAGCSWWPRPSRPSVLVAVLLRLTLIAPFTVPSNAMAPTLQAGDRILVLQSSFLTGSISRGDIIVFHRPAYFPCQGSGPGQYLVERVIGMPGETIWSDHQNIYVERRADCRARMVRRRPRRRELGPDHEDDRPQGRLLRPGRQPQQFVRLEVVRPQSPGPRPSARSSP